MVSVLKEDYFIGCNCRAGDSRFHQSNDSVAQEWAEMTDLEYTFKTELPEFVDVLIWGMTIRWTKTSKRL